MAGDTPTFNDVASVGHGPAGRNVVVDIVPRRARRCDVNVRLAVETVTDRPGSKMRARRTRRSSTTTGSTTRYRLSSAFPMAVEQTLRMTPDRLSTARHRSSRGQRFAETTGGPIKIARVAGSGAELGLLPFIGLVALLSINLGFINLLPVPMLDGGHLFFYVVEAVRRRPLSAQALEWAFRGGLALILALMLFMTVNDLGSLGLWERLQRLIG